METEKFIQLKKWIIENGGTVNDKITIRTNDQYNRSIYSTDKIGKGEVIINIPKNICISMDKFSTIPGSEKIDISNINFNIILSMVLLYHWSLKEKSFFYPYINLLPSLESFAYHPVYKFTENNGWDKISSKITKLIENHHKMIEIIYNKITEINQSHTIFRKNIVKYENIKWCYLILISRQWNNTGLVPLADLFQHSSKSTMLLQTLNENNTMTIGEDVDTGIEIFDNYALYDDVLILTSFGFIDNNEDENYNRYVKILFNKNLNKVETSLDRFKNSELDKYMSTTRIFYMTNNGIQNYLLEYLRIFFLDENDIKIINMNEAYYTKMISLNNESRVFSGIFELIKNNKYINDQTHYDTCMDICKNHFPDEIEYKLAKVTLMSHNVLKATSNILIYKWNSYLVNPFTTKISFDIY